MYNKSNCVYNVSTVWEYHTSLDNTTEHIMYSLVRKERYNHRTTAEVLWRVVNESNGWIVAECKTKKEALRWLEIYSK